MAHKRKPCYGWGLAALVAGALSWGALTLADDPRLVVVLAGAALGCGLLALLNPREWKIAAVLGMALSAWALLSLPTFGGPAAL